MDYLLYTYLGLQKGLAWLLPAFFSLRSIHVPLKMFLFSFGGFHLRSFPILLLPVVMLFTLFLQLFCTIVHVFLLIVPILFESCFVSFHYQLKSGVLLHSLFPPVFENFPRRRSCFLHF